MEKYNKVQYCEKCSQNKVLQDWFWAKDKSRKIPTTIPINIYGYLANGSGNMLSGCHSCDNTNLIETALTQDDYKKICNVSTDPDFFVAMAQLKEKDSIEFYTKLGQMSVGVQNTTQSKPDKTPKCPTCGSANIKKISGTKRWVGTGLFGLASSDLGKTMVCDNCGYKW